MTKHMGLKAKVGMKKQGYNDRLDESLGMRRGKESSMKQSYKDRRDESRGSKKHLDEAQDKIIAKMMKKR